MRSKEQRAIALGGESGKEPRSFVWGEEGKSRVQKKNFVIPLEGESRNTRVIMAEEQYWIPVKLHQPRRVLFVAGPFATTVEALHERALIQSNPFLTQERVGVPFLAKTAKEAKEKSERL